MLAGFWATRQPAAAKPTMARSTDAMRWTFMKAPSMGKGDFGKFFVLVQAGSRPVQDIIVAVAARPGLEEIDDPVAPPEEVREDLARVEPPIDGDAADFRIVGVGHVQHGVEVERDPDEKRRSVAR